MPKVQIIGIDFDFFSLHFRIRAILHFNQVLYSSLQNLGNAASCIPFVLLEHN